MRADLDLAIVPRNGKSAPPLQPGRLQRVKAWAGVHHRGPFAQPLIDQTLTRAIVPCRTES